MEINRNVFSEFLVDRIPERTQKRTRIFRRRRRVSRRIVVSKEASRLLDNLIASVGDGSWNEYIAARVAVEKYIYERDHN